MTLVDSNVVIDVFGDDPNWFDWSRGRLEKAAHNGPLLINDVIYAEASIRYRSIERFDAALQRAGMTLVSIPRAALFLAGKAFADYRSAGGHRSNVLPDFFIGAHAVIEGWPLLTRDTKRYRRHFPTLSLIAPDSD